MRFWETKDWAALRRTTRTRFAPSPTGDLHVGGALCALASAQIAAREGGRYVVRMEDLDPPRVVAGSADRILDDLEWLGLGGDEGPRAGGPVRPYVQSARFSLYAAALDALERAGLTFLCDCSRTEIAVAQSAAGGARKHDNVAQSAAGGARRHYSVASAPHEGEEIPYPGTCRDKDPSRPMRRPPAVRFRGEGDFVLRRGDGVFAYQLAVSVDDLAMAISCVVRGDDLAPSTPRQLAILRALGASDDELPRYLHLPLVRDASGARVAKRTAGARVRELREGGVSAEEIRAALEPFTDGHSALVIPARWAKGE